MKSGAIKRSSTGTIPSRTPMTPACRARIRTTSMCRPTSSTIGIPAPEMSFARPNLQALIREIEALVEKSEGAGAESPA